MGSYSWATHVFAKDKHDPPPQPQHFDGPAGARRIHIGFPTAEDVAD